MKSSIRLACLLAALAAAQAVSAAPGSISFQGKLLRNGRAVDTSNSGPLPMTFRIYDSSTGEVLLYKESREVQVAGGIYHVLLGNDPATVDLTAADGNDGGTYSSLGDLAGDYSLFELWLEVEVNGEILQPRQQMTSVAYALHALTAAAAEDADTLDNLDSTAFALKSELPGSLDADGNVGIGTDSPAAKLDVATIPVDSYGTWKSYDAYYFPCLHCTDTCDGNESSAFTCPEEQTLSCEDLKDSDGEYWKYRVVQCNQAQQAARFTGHVTVTGGNMTVASGDMSISGAVSAASLAGDGAGLTNVTASALAIDCPSDFILQKKASGWDCQPLPIPPAICQDGDFVNCYEGPPATRGVGVCTSGIRTCSNGAYGPCSGQVLPTAENCWEGEDADCDGDPNNYAAENAPGCITLYPDNDQDWFGDPDGPTRCTCAMLDGYPAGYQPNNGDCDDNNAAVGPLAGFHTDPIENSNWDWNCSGQVEKQYTTMAPSSCIREWISNPGPDPGYYVCLPEGQVIPKKGWISSVPGCGVTAGWRKCGDYDEISQTCPFVDSLRTQGCN